MATKKVLIRADASLAIGSGHVMRCLSLAAALRARGADVQFVSRVLPGHLHAAIVAQGYALHALPAPQATVPARPESAHAHWLAVTEDQDVADTRAVLDGLGGVDWLVVDHYALDASWQRALRPWYRQLAVIDDLADRDHDADVLVDQNLGAGGRYDRRVPAGCVQLLGPGYALLRDEFALARRHLRDRSGGIGRVLVFMGGVDAGGYTECAIDALSALQQRPQVDVVVGPANPRAAAIAARCTGLGFECTQGATDMAARMAAADFAIGAGGSTTWERACMGLPALIVIAADNQRPGALAMAAAGCGFAIEGDAATATTLAAAIEELAQDPMRLSGMAQRNLALVDGRGSQRVARIVLPPEIALRRARAEDGEALFTWRNHEDVRRHSHSSEPIERETHDRWFTATLIDRQRDLLIAEHAGQPVGVLRYDVDGDEALVSIYLVPGCGGRGFGPAILRAGHRWLTLNRPRISAVRAEVHGDNAASHKAFREAGYTLRGQDYYRILTT